MAPNGSSGVMEVSESPDINVFIPLMYSRACTPTSDKVNNGK